ncbi:MAG TPA: bifunctional DNA primase/polymerase [Terracidiphilus sp.]|nr:bifunctional DNA primase/polymerase [Terracidiphilus sp.]
MTAKSALVNTLPHEVIEGAQRGWRLFPVKARGKLPLIADWPSKAASDPAALEAWAREYPQCNWGMATCEPSGVFVVDVDGEAGRASLADLERQGLTLPATLTVTTGRADGGTHFYYRMPPGVDIHNDQSGKIGPHIDVRGTGGFVVCPPSVHASGKVYRFVDPSAAIADAPGWVIERLTARQAMPTTGAQASPQAVTKGGRTNALVSLAGTMQRRGMSPEAIEAALLAENAAKCSPPLPESKVRAIARDIPARYPNAPKENGLKLVELGDLLSRPVVPVDWILRGRLAAGSVSLVVSKPKVGKSTLARNLALAIARGEPFLGWAVKRGTVLYLALEERSEDVAADFRALGADGSEDILLADAGTALDVVTILWERKPVLLVVDPLFRLLSVKDEKAYAEMYGALGPLIDAARETGTHICCLHHSSKLAKSEAIDAPLGSTALGGAVSTLIVMRRTETYRTLQTVQRIGEDLPETVLQFDPASKRLALGGSRELEEVHSVGEEILAALGSGVMTAQELAETVEARTTFQRRALREMTESGQIQREGTGKRGDPYRYTKGCSAFPALAKNNGNKKLFGAVSEVQNNDQKKVVPAPITMYGKGGTRNPNDTASPINIEEKVVPNKTELPPLSERNGNKHFASTANQADAVTKERLDEAVKKARQRIFAEVRV